MNPVHLPRSVLRLFSVWCLWMVGLSAVSAVDFTVYQWGSWVGSGFRGTRLVNEETGVIELTCHPNGEDIRMIDQAFERHVYALGLTQRLTVTADHVLHFPPGQAPAVVYDRRTHQRLTAEEQMGTEFGNSRAATLLRANEFLQRLMREVRMEFLGGEMGQMSL